MKIRRDGLHVVNMLLNVFMVVTGILLAYAVVPPLETKYWPVYSKFKLIDAELMPNGEDTKAVFQFTKFRNCDPQGFAFFNGELGASFYQITTRVVGGPDTRARPLGTQVSYPYILKGVTPEELANTVFAEIYSHCHGLWLTRTKVYP